jgi:ribosomal protein S2
MPSPTLLNALLLHLVLLRRQVLGFLKKISFSGGKVLFVSTQPKLARLTRVMGEQSGHFYLARKWAPGLLSNWDKKRLQVRRSGDAWAWAAF